MDFDLNEEQSMIRDTARDFTYLAFDGFHVGELQGEHLARTVPRGRYVFLHGPSTDHNADLFRDGAMKSLRPLVERGDIKVVKEDRVRDYLAVEAERICNEALAGGGGVDAVLAATDSIAAGAVKALAAHGLAGRVPVTRENLDALLIDSGYLSRKAVYGGK